MVLSALKYATRRALRSTLCGRQVEEEERKKGKEGKREGGWHAQKDAGRPAVFVKVAGVTTSYVLAYLCLRKTWTDM